MDDEQRNELLAEIAEKQRIRDERKQSRLANRREWFQNNKEYAYEYAKQYKSRKQHEIAQRPKPLVCEVCCNGGKIVFDHDHNTNKFRGWLCDTCNVILGRVNDNPEWLEKLATYVRNNKDEDAQVDNT